MFVIQIFQLIYNSDEPNNLRGQLQKKAARVEVNGKKFYSQSWRHSNKSDSSIVSYKNDDTTKYAHIKYYATTAEKQTVFAVGNEIKILGNLIQMQDEPMNRKLRELFSKTSYGDFFLLVEKTSTQIFFRVDKIVNHCIIVSDSRKNLYLTEIDEGFEHN